MRLFSVIVIFLFSLALFAQQSNNLKLTHNKKPSKSTEFNVGDKIIVFYSDTSEISGIIKSIDKTNIMLDSVPVPVNKIQVIVDRNPKSAFFKIAGAGMIIGGVALTVTGLYLGVSGLLSISAESLFLVPTALVLDYFGVSFITKGINKLGNKGKLYDVKNKYIIEVIEL